jgi:hypothetical protein
MLPQNNRYIALYSERADGGYALLTIYPSAGSEAAQTKLETPEGIHRVFQFHGKKAGVVMTAALSMGEFLDSFDKELMKTFADEGEPLFAYRAIGEGQFQFHRVVDAPIIHQASSDSERKEREPNAAPLAVHHFKRSVIVREFASGTTDPISTGLTVALCYDGSRCQDAAEDTPTSAILNYQDERGDDDETVIGLGFSGRTLVDYDGVFQLPPEVAGLLQAHGFELEEDTLTEDGQRVADSYEKEVRQAAAKVEPLVGLRVGDQVQVARYGEHSEREYVGKTGIVEKLITDDCGASESDPFVSVSLSNGKRGVFWSEELAMVAKANDNSILSVASASASLAEALAIIQGYLGVWAGSDFMKPETVAGWDWATMSERSHTLRDYMAFERGLLGAALPSGSAAKSEGKAK